MDTKLEDMLDGWARSVAELIRLREEGYRLRALPEDAYAVHFSISVTTVDLPTDDSAA